MDQDVPHADDPRPWNSRGTVSASLRGSRSSLADLKDRVHQSRLAQDLVAEVAGQVGRSSQIHSAAEDPRKFHLQSGKAGETRHHSWLNSTSTSTSLLGEKSSRSTMPNRLSRAIPCRRQKSAISVIGVLMGSGDIERDAVQFAQASNSQSLI